MIEERNGTAEHRHEQRDGDPLQYGVLIEIHEFVHAAILIARHRWGHCD
jgi:hypothetical protein